jgi:hypothetical protein
MRLVESLHAVTALFIKSGLNSGKGTVGSPECSTIFAFDFDFGLEPMTSERRLEAWTGLDCTITMEKPFAHRQWNDCGDTNGWTRRRTEHAVP